MRRHPFSEKTILNWAVEKNVISLICIFISSLFADSSF